MEENLKKDASKQIGAKKRSEVLSPSQRSKIAAKAALKKAGYPSATKFRGAINIGGYELPCAVLEDGRRVVWQREVVGLLTGHKKGGLGRYLSAANLKPFVPEKFQNIDFDENTIVFELDGAKSHGFEAEDIVDICKMYLMARKANALLASQIHLAHQAEIIVLSLAKVGISALIDEATGYQEVRDKKYLQSLLDKYLLKEYAAWAKCFPDEFYKEMFRLRGWEYPNPNNGKPGVVGKYTNDLVYERLAPGLLEELQTRNPKQPSGYRKAKHHQWMSDDLGMPALSTHLMMLIALMRPCSSWEQFMAMVDISLPKKNSQMPLLLDE